MANKITDLIKRAFKVDPKQGTPLPRKGLFTFMNPALNKKQQKQFVINAETLRKLANTDPITWAIRRTIKGYISNIKWDIVPDTEQIEAELDRWEDTIISFINPYGFDYPIFKSEILDAELFNEVAHKVDTVLDDVSITDAEKRDRIRWVFKTMGRKVRDTAESHKHKVKAVFEHPNNAQTSFRALLELLVDDILVFDAGALVKNYNYYGDLAEIYTVPGHEIKLYRNEDGTMPSPPEPSYAWEDKGILRAEFTNDEMLYIIQNPQHTGYGLSGLEVAAYIITASLYADEYNIDYFKHSNVPPGIVDLGPGVSEDQRLIFQKMWENEVLGRAGQQKLVFTAGAEKLNFIPMRTQSNRDMQMMEYLKWATMIKCACYGLSPQDIGFVADFHRTTAEVQDKLSKTRGVGNLLNLLQSYFNEEIVKAEFDFKDVKFSWELEDDKDSIQLAQVDNLDMNQGVMSINERRKSRGMKPIEGGDEHVIKAPSQGMTPVSDLAKINDLRIDPQAIVQQPGLVGVSQPADPNAGYLPTGQKPGPDSTMPIDGDPGRPVGSTEESNIQLSVDGSKSEKQQKVLLNKTVETLKNQGINAVIKIGFDDVNKS